MEQGNVDEINFERLLGKCRQMVAHKEEDGWRFPKYVAALNGMLGSLKRGVNQGKRCETLAKRIATYESNVEFLRKLADPGIQTQDDRRKELMRSESFVSQSSRDYERSSTKEILSPIDISPRIRSPRAPDGWPSQERTETREDPPREALLSRNDGMDVLVSSEMGRQEEIAQEMLNLTKALKENAATANRLVKRDFKVIDNATSLADKNVTRLTKENDKLAEKTKNNTGLWFLFALAAIFGVFVMMVLFMRFVPKRK